MNTKRTHVIIPTDIISEIDSFVGARQRSSFLTEAAKKQLMRLRQIAALKTASGAWKDKDHPELKAGSAKWVRKLRRESEYRFQKIINR